MSPTFTKLSLISSDYISLESEDSHLQRPCLRPSHQEIYLLVPRLGLCRRVQSEFLKFQLAPACAQLTVLASIPQILQRIYKYGGQPFVRDYLAKHYGNDFDSAFGKGTGKAIMNATAGSLIGIGEIVLLPLDVLKIKRQTNPGAFRSRGFFRIIADEGMGLYRGAGWTAARNAPGSFALFGGSAFAKEKIFKLQDYNAASWSQNFVASICGASASLIVSAPLDVIKTRIQNRNFEHPESGFRIVASMMKNEGFTSFFKGLTPKMLMTGPKLVFSFWLAQVLIPAFGKVV